jgi:hypothetical protein
LDIQESSMLERTSRFVLEVLPYLLCALIAAVVVPGFLFTQVHGTKATVVPPSRGENALELIRRDHAAFAPDQKLSDGPAKTAGNKLAYR